MEDWTRWRNTKIWTFSKLHSSERSLITICGWKWPHVEGSRLCSIVCIVYYISLYSYKLCPWFGSILHKAPAIVSLYLSKYLQQSIVCRFWPAFFQANFERHNLWKREFSGSCKTPRTLSSPESPLRNPRDVTTHLEGLGWWDKCCLEFEKPLRKRTFKQRLPSRGSTPTSDSFNK